MKEVIDEIIMNDTLFSLIILFLCLMHTDRSVVGKKRREEVVFVNR